ncbi:MAG: MBL fold metallo-hydrolase [Proteobacteria bacterium]|nr:MBL fold metallo-hydrolase [Pseudomonadota bacterium]
MFIKQYYLGCLSHASYMIGDEETRSAIVVDPQRDVDTYIRDAEAKGLTIRDVVLTHFHADFVAGHLELQKRTGANIVLGAKAEAAYPFVPKREGDTIEYGSARIQVLETPGHTPESISLVAYDTKSDPARPQAVLTGDALFVGDVGRPDLMVSSGHSASELAGALYDSLHDKLLRLPDDTVVYPAHGPGSLCGSGHTSDTKSTIGHERESNFALQPMSKEQFVDTLTRDLTEAPAYFARDAVLNKAQHATLEDELTRETQPLSVDETVLLKNQGAQVLDVRPPDDFAAGHLNGSVNVGLDGRFASWAGILLDATRPIVVVASPGREEEAILRLGRVGFDQVKGYVDGGQTAIATRPELVGTTPRATAAEVAHRLESAEPPFVLDVRTPDEWNTAHIEGSVNIPLSELAKRQGEIPHDRPIIVHCQSGYRSSMAMSLLEQQGGDLTEMTGGIAAWLQAGLPTVHTAAAR